MEIKKGWKTTEFWVSIATAIVGVGVMFGLLTTEESSQIIGGIDQIIGGIMTVVSMGIYALSRGKTKSGIDYSQIISLLGSFNEKPTMKFDKEQLQQIIDHLKNIDKKIGT